MSSGHGCQTRKGAREASFEQRDGHVAGSVQPDACGGEDDGDGRGRPGKSWLDTSTSPLPSTTPAWRGVTYAGGREPGTREQPGTSGGGQHAERSSWTGRRHNANDELLHREEQGHGWRRTKKRKTKEREKLGVCFTDI